MPRRRAPVIAAASAVCVALAVLVLAWPWPWLIVRRGAALRYAFPGGEGTRFAVRWQHSVEKEDWIEYYRIRRGAIEIVATRFKTFGAGVPAHAGQHTRLVDGWVEMSGIDRDVDPLAIQAAAAEHYRLRVADGRWRALSRRGRAPILEFSAERAPLLWVWRGVLAAAR